MSPATDADGTPHRREDGELIGWILPHESAWRGIDLLGRTVCTDEDWLVVEAALEERGIGFLADVWTYDHPEQGPLRVRMVEVTPQHIVVKTDDFGAIDAPVTMHTLAWPLPDTLTPGAPRDAGWA